MEPTPPYRELIPGTPEHRDFISNAIVNRNFAHLAALKNRTDKTIHVVSNWFYYSIMQVDNSQDIVIIYNENDTATLERILSTESW
jgi:hypothetical protein